MEGGRRMRALLKRDCMIGVRAETGYSRLRGNWE